MRGHRGVTIIELVIASALFLLALIVIGQLALMGMRTKAVTEDKNEAFRSGTIAQDLLERDIAHCDQVYFPDPLTSAHPGQNGEGPLVIRTCNDGKKAVVGYRLDAEQRVLERFFYEPDFDPAKPATQKLRTGDRTRQQANWVEDFRIARLDPTQFGGCKLLETEILISTTYKGDKGTHMRLATRTRSREL